MMLKGGFILLWKFNEAQSKYRGSDAGEKRKANDFIDEHEAELMEPMEQRVQKQASLHSAES